MTYSDRHHCGLEGCTCPVCGKPANYERGWKEKKHYCSNGSCGLTVPIPSKLIELTASEDSTVQSLARTVIKGMQSHTPETSNGGETYYCGCGSLKSFIAEDGYASLGPEAWPCESLRELYEGVGCEVPTEPIKYGRFVGAWNRW